MQFMTTTDGLVEKVEALLKLLVSNTTGSSGDQPWTYAELRKELL
jgi:hypothetical protein